MAAQASDHRRQGNSDQPRYAHQVAARRDQQQGPLVALIDHMPGVEGETKSRQEFRETDQPDGKRIMRDLVDPPAYRGRHGTQRHDIKKPGRDQPPVFRDA